MRKTTTIMAAMGTLLMALPATAQQRQKTTTTTTTTTTSQPGRQPVVVTDVDTDVAVAPGTMTTTTDAEMTGLEAKPRMRQAVIMTDVDAEQERHLVTPMGMALSIGAGGTGFIDEEARDFTTPGGAWDARLIIGTRSIVGVEVGYIGGAQDIDAIGLDEDAFLLKNGAEAAARLNFLPGILQPYILAGAGWTNFRITNDSFNTSALEDSDNIVHFPLGAGLAVRYSGLLLDGRAVVRPAVEDDMFAVNDGSLHTWDAKLSAGWEF